MTTAARTRWPLDQATTLARYLVGYLARVCDRVEIAGSIRRRRPDVGDIELVCLPKYVDVPGSAQPDMFHPVVDPSGTASRRSCLDTWVFDNIHQGVFRPRPDARGRPTLGPLNKLVVHVESGIPVDIFTATRDNFGMALLVRTGPKEFNVRIMSKFREMGMRGEAYGGIIDRDGRRHNCPDEEAVFSWLGWEYVPPEKREMYRQ